MPDEVSIRRKSVSWEYLFDRLQEIPDLFFAQVRNVLGARGAGDQPDAVIGLDNDII